MKPSKLQRSKQIWQDLCGRSTTVHNLLFCPHTLCMNYVTETFLLVSCLNTRNHLLYFVRFCARQGQKSEQKDITNNFAGLHNHFPLLTMMPENSFCNNDENHQLNTHEN